MALPWSDFLTAWSFLAVNVISPGPNVLNTVAAAMGGGRAAGLGSAAGVGLGVALWCAGMSLGVAAAFALFPWLRLAMTAVAVGLLALFAWRYLRAAWRGWRGRWAGLPAALPRDGFGAALRRSLAVNATNPKALTTWLAILAIFPVARAGGGDLAVLTLGAAAVAAALHAVYALAFAAPVAARAWLRAGWAVSGAAGLFFGAFALRLALAEFGG